MDKNPQIHLIARPQGVATVDQFKAVTAEQVPLQEGEVRVRNHFLSVDPYMRMRLEDAKSYAAPQALGEVMAGGTAGEVVESRHPRFAVGDAVTGMGGWQLFSVFSAAAIAGLRKIDVTRTPLSSSLGAFGMPGVTAWYGLLKIIEPKAGETVLVSAASGAVGSVVGQLAKRRGARAVGIAGGPEKCAHVVNELGFDACVDHKAHADTASLTAALRAACPQGIDGNFENVGGIVLDAAMACMNTFGRIAVCGSISGYDSEAIPMAEPRRILTQRLKLEGFIISDQLQIWPEALAELGELVASGKLVRHETIAQGLDAAPAALLGLLTGRNLGKQLVKLI